jgi:hypothetical protein
MLLTHGKPPTAEAMHQSPTSIDVQQTQNPRSLYAALPRRALRIADAGAIVATQNEGVLYIKNWDPLQASKMAEDRRLEAQGEQPPIPQSTAANRLCRIEHPAPPRTVSFPAVFLCYYPTERAFVASPPTR